MGAPDPDPPPPDRCQRGHVGPLCEQPARLTDRTANVDTVCTACGVVLETVSYRLAAWPAAKGGR